MPATANFNFHSCECLELYEYDSVSAEPSENDYYGCGFADSGPIAARIDGTIHETAADYIRDFSGEPTRNEFITYLAGIIAGLTSGVLPCDNRGSN